MQDYVEKHGGDLRIKPKSHIRGEERSPLREVKKWERSQASKFEERKSEVSRLQEIGAAREELKPGAENVEWERPDVRQTEESLDWKEDLNGEKNEEKYADEPEETLRGDLETRNQPEPGHYKSSGRKGPKHWRA